MKSVLTTIWTLVIFLFCGQALPEALDAGRADRLTFSLTINRFETPYRIASAFTLPGENLSVRVTERNRRSQYTMTDATGREIRGHSGRWNWKSPTTPGNYTLLLSNTDTRETATIHVFVMVPFQNVQKGYLNGYRIGSYPKNAYKNLPIYLPPRGFIEVTPRNMDIRISPHFRLSQFLCKQTGSFPKYIVLSEKLILKLEMILEKVNQAGIPCRTFNILSGYRTPYYNKAIGNVKYSRHVYGGAADIFVDEDPRDDMMDDLNEDGRIDYRDAAVLYDLIDALYGRPAYTRYWGGLGWYRKNHVHGPFVHVDVRGFRARWGD